MTDGDSTMELASPLQTFVSQRAFVQLPSQLQVQVRLQRGAAASPTWPAGEGRCPRASCAEDDYLAPRPMNG
jgi:hypothetical protein